MRLPTPVRPNSLKVDNIWKWQILLKLENIPFLKLPYMEIYFGAGRWLMGRPVFQLFTIITQFSK